MMHYGYGYMGFGWLFQLLILVLFFAVIWWIVKGKFSSESPGEILKKRLASGEITMKEYEKLKREIQ